MNKGPAFRKGPILRERDIEALLDMGKAHIYALELSFDQLHEDAADGRIAAAPYGPGLTLTTPSEGRINLIAEYPGLLTVYLPALTRLNSIQHIVFATLHGNHRVRRSSSGRDAGDPSCRPQTVQRQMVACPPQPKSFTPPWTVGGAIPPCFDAVGHPGFRTGPDCGPAP